MAELVEQLAERVDHLDIDNGDFYERVMAVPGNGECADCSSQELLTWASVNLGVVLCNECVGAHRSLGVHISKPLSLKMDLWDAAHQAHFLELGNRLVNATFEVHPDTPRHKPAPGASIEEKQAFAKSKYKLGSFKADGDGVLAASAQHTEGFDASRQVHAGIAFVRVQHARDLVDMDGHIFDGVSDPYVLVRTFTNRTARTKTIMNNLNPVWNESLMLNIDDPMIPLDLEVFNENDGHIRCDNPLGDAPIPLADLEPGVPTPMTLALSNVPHGGRGTVEIEVTWTPLDA